MDRILPFTQEHEQFREMARKFFETEVMPHHEEFEKNKVVPRSIWKKAGEFGLLCPDAPQEYGGAGADFLYNIIVIEEASRAGNSAFFISLHNDVVAPYLTFYANEEQKKKWIPRIVSGDTVLAVAMTEPGAGSDLKAMRTTAVDKGDYFLVNGQKTFISNGQSADLIITAVKHDTGAMSLVLIEEGMEGFKRGRNLDKMGLKGNDTSELYFEDVKVPKANILGKQGNGFRYLMQKLAQERLVLAVAAVEASFLVQKLTLRYIKERQAFGKKVGSFQNTKFKMAEMATELEMCRVFVDKVVIEHMKGKNTTVEASMAKWYATEMQKRHTDECLQFFGGYGYMMEYPIARAYLDARIQTIYAGTTEIMKEIVGSSLGL